jgi:IMP dehydrogenase
MKAIKSEMVDFPFVIEPTMTIAEAQIFMKQQNLRHLPVVDKEDKLLGVVSERDILASKGPNSLITTIMVTHVYMVSENVDLVDVIEKMAEEKYGSVMIVNSANELTGIFTTTDALVLLAKMLRSPGEYKNGKVLSFFSFKIG